jgi:16S rRNA (cytosine1402-N4)-methyltransferase
MTESAQPKHLPVMAQAALQALSVRPGLTYVDATAGAGGHLSEIIKLAAPGGTVFGIDQDNQALSDLKQRFQRPINDVAVNLVHANYSSIEAALGEFGIDTVSGGILADLGVSSMQLDNADRGFSFLKDGPLDMRMDSQASLTAEKIVNTWPEKELADIIFKFGEERLSRAIARRIVESRPLKTTAELAAVVSPVVSRHSRGKHNRDLSHPATRTFQALRIAVNDELANLEKFLHAAVSLLSPGARLVVITFHSLEDRLVKQILRQAAQSCICPPRQPICTCQKKQEIRILTPKPLLPDAEEVLANPRSRSAKLRAGEKVSTGDT